MPVTSSLNLRVEEIAAGRPNRPGTIINVTHVTVHNTDNDSRGADASAHSGFVRNTGFYMLGDRKNWVSWHFTVDDGVAIRHLPLRELAFHAGPGNARSVAIEICMNAGINQAAANSRAALLVATLMRDLSIPIANVVTHRHWTGKACPSRLLDSAKEGRKWAAFLDEVKAFLSSLEQEGGSPLFPQAETEAPGDAKPLESLSADELTADMEHDLVREQVNSTLP